MNSSILKLSIVHKHVEDFITIWIHYAHPEVFRVPGKISLSVRDAYLMAACSGEVGGQHHATTTSIPTLERQVLSGLQPVREPE